MLLEVTTQLEYILFGWTAWMRKEGKRQERYNNIAT
jgi:hypothetical protein